VWPNYGSRSRAARFEGDVNTPRFRIFRGYVDGDHRMKLARVQTARHGTQQEAIPIFQLKSGVAIRVIRPDAEETGTGNGEHSVHGLIGALARRQWTETQPFAEPRIILQMWVLVASKIRHPSPYRLARRFIGYAHAQRDAMY